MALWNDLSNFLFPRYCICCGERIFIQEDYLCINCLGLLPRTYSHLEEESYLEQAFWGRIPIQRAASFFFYEAEGVRKLIWEFKYNEHPRVASFLAEIYAREMSGSSFFDGVDIIVPVPLSSKKKRSRGYNQCDYIARGISKVTGIPVITDAVIINAEKKTQTHLGKAERLENVEDIFKTLKPDSLRGKHILLVDDVLTTGATLCSLGSTIASHVEGVTFSVLTLALAGEFKGMPYVSRKA